MKSIRLKVAFTAVAFGVIATTSAQAALVACGPAGTVNLLSKVESASKCEYLSGSSPNNTASIAHINDARFFGSSDWSDNFQTQIDPSNDQSGSWTIAGANFALFDYIIVFKSGAPTNLVAFLFDESISTGKWRTPFMNPPWDVKNPKDVSHYTIARRNGVPPTGVPEPMSLALLGIGLLGVGAARSLRKA